MSSENARTASEAGVDTPLKLENRVEDFEGSVPSGDLSAEPMTVALPGEGAPEPRGGPSAQGGKAPRRKRRDRRLVAIVIALTSILAIGLTLAFLPAHDLKARLDHLLGKTEPDPARQGLLPGAEEKARKWEEIDRHFKQAVIMLHARQYEYAVVALNEVLKLAPRMAEAHVNMGFALLGLNKPQDARDSFTSAINLRPQQVNAYYGLALALDATQELEGSVGAMRTYLHLTGPDDKYRGKAQAFLDEREARLKALRQK